MKKYENVVEIWRIWIISHLFHYNIREADLLLAGLCSLISSRLPSCNKYPSFLAKIVFSIKWTGLFCSVNRFISGTLPFLKKVSIWYDCAPWPSAQSGFFFVQKKVAGTSKNSNISDLLKNRMFQKLVKKVWKINISDRKKQLSGESVMHSDDLWRRSWQKWICLVVRSKLKNLFNFQGSWTGLSAGVVKICRL